MTPVSETDCHRQPKLYWTKLFQLKVGAAYMRRYRDDLAKWITRFNALRAVASSTAIAGWAVVHTYDKIWGSIIAASQVADAMKDVVPLIKRQKATSELSLGLAALFIDAQIEWESIFAGKLTNDEITSRLRKLMKIQHDLEAKHFPNGLPERKDLFRLAEAEAILYFKATFGTEPNREQE